MRRRALVAASVAFGALVFGCVDLFHDTDFAGGDASAADASAETSVAPLDFCTSTRDEAKARAVGVCARLAACELPIGNNAPGACLADAILAYDCTAAPNRQVKGIAHDTWQCLARATTCDAVDACVFGGPIPTCQSSGGEFTACRGTTRLDCPGNGARAYGEPCAVRGKTCRSPDTGGTASEAFCTGNEPIGCLGHGCNGTRLQECAARSAGFNADEGLDCASFGAQTCASIPDGGGPTCVANGGTSCAATTTITCDGDVAVGCASGVEERVDCAALGATCTTSPSSGFAWDVARACVAAAPDAATTCTEDRCSDDGSQLLACVRGTTMPITCASLGLKPCALVDTFDGKRATCTRP